MGKIGYKRRKNMPYKKKITCRGCLGEKLFIRKTRGFIFYEIVKT